MMFAKRKSTKLVIGIVIVLVLLVVLYFIVPMFIKNSVCVTRSVSGELNKTITLDVKVSPFSKPNSFLIEENLPLGWNFVSSAPGELIYNGNGKISWMFWRGGLGVESTKIIYNVNNATSGGAFGRLYLGVDSNNPDAGYDSVEIGTREACL